MNALRMVNVLLLSVCSAAGALSFEHGQTLPGILCAVAVGMMTIGLIVRLAITSKFE